jgi:hypothetical protein
MPRQDRNQVIDADGNIISEEIVEVPVPVIGEDELRQAKQNLRAYFAAFTTDGAPSGSPTDNQNRNAILSLIVVVRSLAREMDNEIE